MDDPTFLIRAGLGVAFFAIMGIVDLIRHPREPNRAKEYAFLFAITGAAMGYAVIHDFATYHISPAYFVYGKGLAEAREGFGWPVVNLALAAGWSPGLIAGAVLLMANNPGKRFGRLPYRVLWRYATVPLGASAGMAVALGCIFYVFAGPIAATIEWPLSEKTMGGFVTVWGIHIGTYLGAVVGTAGAVVGVRRSKRHANAPGT